MDILFCSDFILTDPVIFRSVVDVAIRYHATSVVDVDEIKRSLVEGEGIVLNRTNYQRITRREQVNHHNDHYQPLHHD